jgi:hypothetical protein
MGSTRAIIAIRLPSRQEAFRYAASAVGRRMKLTQCDDWLVQRFRPIVDTPSFVLPGC